MKKVEITFPYDGRLSINQLYKNSHKGRSIDNDTKRVIFTFTIRTRALLRKHGIEGKKLRIDLCLYKPRANVDPQNFLKAFCDIVADALFITDEEFETSTKGMLDKDHPRFVLTVTQLA